MPAELAQKTQVGAPSNPQEAIGGRPLRIEGIQGAVPVRTPVRVARLRGVAPLDPARHAAPSRNRMIAATGRAPNVTAPAPTRLLTPAERMAVADPRSLDRERRAVDRPMETERPAHASAATDAGRPAHASVVTEADADRSSMRGRGDAGPEARPPSLPIRPGAAPSTSRRAAARAAFGDEVVRAYERAGAGETARSRFDILA
jgi:hypothetical protein